MPSEKEIEEVINALADPESDYRFKSGYCMYLFRDAYLAMKAERDLLIIEKQHKQNCYDNLKESARQNDVELNEQIDKLKAIVDADTEAINLAYKYVNDGSPLPARDDPYWDVESALFNALAMRDKE